MRKYLNLRANIALGLTFAFLTNTLGPLPLAKADEFRLPAPGVRVGLSPEFNPPILKGLKVHPDNPFRFDFILDQGDGNNRHPERSEGSQKEQLKSEATKLIKYFLASLTIPEKDLWVNLSPYERNRIVPESFGRTEMGRDLLAEDYMLKQITASLIYPEDAIGKKFWKRIYEEAAKKFGTTNIPVNTFNKVWIVPEKAVVYENAKAGTAYVVESKLKVMLEQDYLALSHNVIPAPSTEGRSPEGQAGIQNKNDINTLGSQIVREIVIPELTKEVNEGKNFAQLRQVYNSLILATWYKKKIKDSILEQVYAGKSKVAGVSIDDPQEKERIYERYLQAFKKGAYNYIKEEIDPATQQTIPRKYFSGGMDLAMTNLQATLKFVQDPATVAGIENNDRTFDASVDLKPSDSAMIDLSPHDNLPILNNTNVVVNGEPYSLFEIFKFRMVFWGLGILAKNNQDQPLLRLFEVIPKSDGALRIKNGHVLHTLRINGLLSEDSNTLSARYRRLINLSLGGNGIGQAGGAFHLKKFNVVIPEIGTVLIDHFIADLGNLEKLSKENPYIFKKLIEFAFFSGSMSEEEKNQTRQFLNRDENPNDEIKAIINLIVRVSFKSKEGEGESLMTFEEYKTFYQNLEKALNENKDKDIESKLVDKIITINRTKKYILISKIENPMAIDAAMIEKSSQKPKEDQAMAAPADYAMVLDISRRLFLQGMISAWAASETKLVRAASQLSGPEKADFIPKKVGPLNRLFLHHFEKKYSGSRYSRSKFINNLEPPDFGPGKVIDFADLPVSLEYDFPAPLGILWEYTQEYPWLFDLKFSEGNMKALVDFFHTNASDDQVSILTDPNFKIFSENPEMANLIDAEISREGLKGTAREASERLSKAVVFFRRWKYAAKELYNTFQEAVRTKDSPELSRYASSAGAFVDHGLKGLKNDAKFQDYLKRFWYPLREAQEQQRAFPLDEYPEENEGFSRVIFELRHQWAVETLPLERHGEVNRLYREMMERLEQEWNADRWRRAIKAKSVERQKSGGPKSIEQKPAAGKERRKAGQLSDKDFLTTNGLLLTPDERKDLPPRVNRKALPEHKRIVVLENTLHQAEAYAGNLIQALREKENSVKVLSLSTGDIWGPLSQENPDLILLQDNDQNMETLLRTYAGWINSDIPVLYYPNLDYPKEAPWERPLTIRPNLSVLGDYIEVAQEAIRAHRRPYDKVAYFTSQAMARIAKYLDFKAEEGDHANNLVVVEMDQNGEWKAPDLTVKYQFTDGGPVKKGFVPVQVPEGMDVTVISPHADDPEIVDFNLIIRSLLQGANVYNFVYSTGRNGVDNDDPLLTAFMSNRGMSNGEIDQAKILLREEEAREAARILQSVPGVKGTMYVKPLRIDMLSDDQKRESMIAALEPLVKKHKEKFPDLPVVVSLPHLVDEHKTHQEATKYTLEALSELAKRHKVKVQLLFYLAPWSGDYNTYFHYSRGKEPVVAGEHKEIQDILDPLSQGFAYTTSSLTGGHGKKSLSPQEMGGEFVERFRRAMVSPVSKQTAGDVALREFQSRGSDYLWNLIETNNSELWIPSDGNLSLAQQAFRGIFRHIGDSLQQKQLIENTAEDILEKFFEDKDLPRLYVMHRWIWQYSPDIGIRLLDDSIKHILQFHHTGLLPKRGIIENYAHTSVDALYLMTQLDIAEHILGWPRLKEKIASMPDLDRNAVLTLLRDESHPADVVGNLKPDLRAFLEHVRRFMQSPAWKLLKFMEYKLAGAVIGHRTVYENVLQQAEEFFINEPINDASGLKAGDVVKINLKDTGTPVFAVVAEEYHDGVNKQGYYLMALNLADEIELDAKIKHLFFLNEGGTLEKEISSITRLNFKPGALDAMASMTGNIADIIFNSLPVKQDLAMAGGIKKDEAMAGGDEAMTIQEVEQIMDIAFTQEDIGRLNFMSGYQEYMDNKDLIASIWQPYFNQIINESGLTVENFILKYEIGKLPGALMERLKAPSTRSNDRSENNDKLEFDKNTVRVELKEKLRLLMGHGSAPGKIKIVLGGTLFTDVKFVINMLDGVLREIASELGIKDIDNWVKGWDVEIRAMGIETAYLVNIEKQLNDEQVPHKEWVKLEYIDLLDTYQWVRLSSQPADIMFVSNSLYIGSWSYLKVLEFDPIIMPLKLKDLNFIAHVNEFVKPGGIFITEVPYNPDGRHHDYETTPLVPGFNPIIGPTWYSIERYNGEPMRTGVYVKEDQAVTGKNNGGIDLTSDKALTVQNNGQGIKFHLDPAQLEQLRNAPGFVPVIINIEPLGDLRQFLGIK